MVRAHRAALVLVLLACAACSDGRDEQGSTAREGATAAEVSAEPARVAIRAGQCGYVEPGAVRGGPQPAVLDLVELGPGIPVALHQLQLRPVSGSWFCVLRTVVGGTEPPPPRPPRDLGRFTLLREERRTVDAAGASDSEEWLYVIDPAWVEQLADHRGALEEAPPARRPALCTEVGRARPDPERVRSAAVTAMRHFVATGELRRPETGQADQLEREVRAIVELCEW